MNRLNKEQLEEIRQRAEAATEGPWKVGVANTVVLADADFVEVAYAPLEYKDADFIANARQDIPALLDHIAKLQGKIDLYESYAQEYDYYAILNEMGDEDDSV